MAKGLQNWSPRALGTKNKRSRFLDEVEYIQGIMCRQGMVGCGYSRGKPRYWVMIREVVSLDMLVVMGEITACVGGGTKEVSEL